ncbi:hypothetical protein GGE12_004473 [Rhizobium mongolense]|uniref:Uncharacterized protein n=1 Tax=Rhizobium mongolense TaxID=57676 RepID=A0A7W6RRD5_9HYPH|nr:hypothetical protein [Rhizobium mongolense]
MDSWDNDVLDLVEEAHLTFQGAADGEIAFVALKGFLDVRYGARDGSACAEFSWEDKTRATRPVVADGLLSAPPDALSGTSTSTTETIQASSANATDFFNCLLVVGQPLFFSISEQAEADMLPDGSPNSCNGRNRSWLRWRWPTRSPVSRGN